MTAAEPPVVALVAHARSVPLAARQSFSRRLLTMPHATLVLETCHRVEAYTVASQQQELATSVPPGGELLEGDAAARHAIEVAVGLDSIVVGEDQILHQVRSAIAAARRERRVGRLRDRRVAGRLLREPLERLGRDADGRADRAARELFAL